MFRLLALAAIAIWAFYAAPSHADTIPATYKATTTVGAAATTTGSTVQQACDLLWATQSVQINWKNYGWIEKAAVGMSCMAGHSGQTDSAYGTVSLTCPTDYTLNGTSCEQNVNPCEQKAGQTAGSGLYDIGTKSTNSPDASACNNGCMVSFSGTSPAFTQVINGKTHYYAEGTYTYVNFECSSGTLPGSVATLPPPTCGTGQAMGTVNGKTVCVNVSDGKIANTNDPVQQSTTNKTTTTNPDGSTTETITKYYSDGSSSSAATTTNPDGSSSTVTTVTPSATGDKPPTDEAPDICSTSPNIPACKDPDSGQAVATNGLYSAPSDRKTFDTVFSNFKASVEQAPFYAAATGFFQVNIPAGTCSGLNNTSEVYGTAWTVDPGSVLCSSDAEPFYNLLSIGLMLAAVWVAYRIAFL